MIARLIAIILLLGALLAAGVEGLRWAESGSYDALTAGELWYAIDRDSLNVAQAGIQRHVAPWLWDPVIVSLLTLPVWAVLGVPALLLLWVAKPRTTKKRYFTSSGN